MKERWKEWRNEGREGRKMEGRERDRNTRTDDCKALGNDHSRKVIQGGFRSYV